MYFYENRNLIIKGQSPQIGNLWLGDYQSARNKRKLKGDLINAVVTAGLGMKISYTSEYKHKMLPLYDHPSENIQRFFDSSYQFINQALQTGNLLIHCYAGVSRSTTILAAYLMRKNGWQMKQTLTLIKKSRPFINPNQGFSSQLKKFQNELNGNIQKQGNIGDKIIRGQEKQFLGKVRIQGRKSYGLGTATFTSDKKMSSGIEARDKSVAHKNYKVENPILELRSKTAQKRKKY